VVDKGSGAYLGGKVTGAAVGTGIASLAVANAAVGLESKVAIHGATTRSNILGGLGWPTFKSFFGSLDKKAAISACVSPCLGNEHGDTSQLQQNTNRRSNKTFRTDFARTYLELLAFLLMESFFLEHSLRQHLKRSLMKNWRA